ncbi:hypothetical protein [Winogradskyella sp.]
MERKKSFIAILFVALFAFSTVADSFEDVIKDQTIAEHDKTKKIKRPTNG